MINLTVFDIVGYVLSAVVFTIPLVINGINKKQYVLTGIFGVACMVIGYMFGFVAAMGVFFFFLIILAVIEQKKLKNKS